MTPAAPTDRSFPVILIPQPEGGFFVECPALAGCYSQGETRADALANIREAIELVLEDMAAQGEPVPPLFHPIIDEVRVAV